ncbi:uncharacterized protein K02A2.6-like [Topomyia yanbarensis]|uniref:uncharacterized protein K02A2.6-like n=1 Tax=Topomyia yanbarensis TaxID=2498891 RepID=UPI00273B5ACB|nr:uncharacterized protein K02A2.6-like [Topomyia yanbarensis]
MESLQESVTILNGTDHKPLINIFNKPLLTAPKRLQHMLLNLQRYQLSIEFVAGKENVVADAISRAPHDDYSESDEFRKLNIYKIFKQLEDCSMSSYSNISDSCLDSIMEATEQDAALQAVKDFIRNGWPNSINRVPSVAKIYFKYRNELSTQDGFIFRNDRIVIPVTLQRCIIDKVHVSHNGIESTLKLARENVFWPGMSAQITDVVKECATCAKFAPSQQKPPMQSHAIAVYPWQIVSMDVFFAMYRNYIELDILKDMSARRLAETCRMNFARHGIPQIINTDNGTNFVNEEMKEMAVKWNFRHSTSSPYHQQGNGKAESAVKIAKRLIQKAEETNQDIWYVLLHWRNIPNKIGSSPVTRLFSRSTRCGVPASAEKYALRIVHNVPEAILENKRKMKYYYDRKSRELPVLQIGSPVYVQLHSENSKSWTPAIVNERLNDRSYVVDVNGSYYRRDLVNIKPRKEPTINHSPNYENTRRESECVYTPVLDEMSTRPLITQPTEMESNELTTPVVMQSAVAAHAAKATSARNSQNETTMGSTIINENTTDAANRPKRQTKLPSKFNEYVMYN